MRLERKDWEDLKKMAEAQLKQAEMQRVVNEQLLKQANAEIDKIPKEKPKMVG